MSQIDFDFFPVPRIHFGIGRLAALPSLLGPAGSNLLVVYNGGERTLAAVADVLKSSSVRLTAYRQHGEPTVDHVDAGLEIGRRAGCTGLIAVGGGSAIDAGKAIAGLLANGGSAMDYMEVIGAGQKITQAACPWIAIPTTAGTGAEVTRNAVIGEPSKKFKSSIRSELLLPMAVIVDAELGRNVSPRVSACSGMDALCQCIEGYTSSGASPMTDPLALKGIRLAARALPRVVHDGNDLAARQDMALAALLSGIVLTNAGLGAVHGFAAPIGANFPAPHGAVCAALLPHVIRANVRVAGDALRERYADIGRALVAEFRIHTAEAALLPAEITSRLFKDLAIPPLRAFGLSDHCVLDMITLAKKASSMKFNPVPLSDVTLTEILRAAIHA